LFAPVVTAREKHQAMAVEPGMMAMEATMEIEVSAGV
jgi:hypothetical protein